MSDKLIPEKEEFFCSWSGGKDSCLALYRCMKAGAVPKYLVSMLREDGMMSRSHGLPPSILEMQAHALGIPLVTRCTSWSEYGDKFSDALNELKRKGISRGVFGDIDLEPHRDWVENICKKSGMTACLPLWQDNRLENVKELLISGFECMIVAIRQEKLGNDFLGRVFDMDLVGDFIRLGVDPCGENGEYHTVVLNGPMFSHRIEINSKGLQSHSGYSFLCY